MRSTPELETEPDWRRLPELGIWGPAGTEDAAALHGYLQAAQRSDDRAFLDSPEPGDAACLCSRCGERIDDEVVLRVFLDNATERRYHLACLGITAEEGLPE